MMDNNILDNQQETMYNEVNAVYEHIDMAKREPINDTECTHDEFIVDPTDTLGDAVYHGCANPKCGRGWYVRQ
jgi:hypothetical protein